MAEGLVGPPSRRPRQGPGRPELGYSLTPKAEASLPRNYHELCTCLVQAIAGSMSEEEALGLFQRAGRHLAEKEGLAAESRPARRLQRARSFLESRGYYPEAGKMPDQLTLSHCPYREIAERWPIVCQFDRALLEGLTSMRVEFAARIVDNDPACVLTLRPDTF
jgi:predicted ArsR family transcriptional regulator